jgi:hypothetical protein
MAHGIFDIYAMDPLAMVEQYILHPLLFLQLLFFHPLSSLPRRSSTQARPTHRLYIMADSMRGANATQDTVRLLKYSCQVATC